MEEEIAVDSPVLWIILIGVAILMFLGFKQNRKIKKEGLDAKAVVTRIEEHRDADDDGPTVEYKYFVEYRAQDGKTYEAELGSVPKRTQVGDEMIIKYLPDRPYYVLPKK